MEVGTRRRPSALKIAAAIAVVMAVALLLATPAAQSFIKDLVASPFQPRYPEEVTYSLERKLTVSANGGEVTSYAFDIPEPKDIVQNGQVLQKVVSVSYSPEVSERSVRYGQEWVEWRGNSLAGDGTIACTVVYDVTVRTHFWNIDEGRSLTVEDVPAHLKEAYLHDEWKINMTSPAVAAQSREIVGDETNVYVILKNIYDWMLDNVKYASAGSGEPQSSEQTLSMRMGDCDDQSILFIALARAAGVPAWLQLGAVYVRQDDRWGGHGWLQAYVPLRDGGGENVSIDVVNKDFLVQQPNRLIDFTDDGVAEHLLDYYYTFSSAFGASDRAPIYSEEYVQLSYKESYKKVSQGTVYDLVPEAIPLGTAPRSIRI